MMLEQWRRVRAVLFDLDGTLIDSAPDLGAAANAMRVGKGLEPLPPSAYREHAGSGARGMLGVAFEMTPSHPEYDVYRGEFLRRYEACMLQQTRPFPEVAPLVEQLKTRDLAWAIVTNKVERFALPLVAALSPLMLAHAVVGGDTTGYAKPHPEPLLEAARRIGVPPDCCVYVGDDERDIVAGKAAGMLTVAARYGYLGPQANVDRWCADAEILNLLELLKLLDLP